HEAELGVPVNHLRLRSIRRLVCPDRRDPRVVAHERSPQWNDLSLVAALLGVRYVERSTVQPLVIPHRRVRPDHLHLDPIPLGDLVPQRQGLGKLVTRVQVKDADTGLNLGQEMNQDTAFRTKRGRHRQLWKESLDGPPQNLRGRCLNEQFVDLRQLFLGQHRFSPGHGVRAPQIVESGLILHFPVMKVNIASPVADPLTELGRAMRRGQHFANDFYRIISSKTRSIWLGASPPVISTPSSMFRLKAYFVRFADDRNSQRPSPTTHLTCKMPSLPDPSALRFSFGQ